MHMVHATSSLNTDIVHIYHALVVYVINMSQGSCMVHTKLMPIHLISDSPLARTKQFDGYVNNIFAYLTIYIFFI
jgi:hypothetical protein